MLRLHLPDPPADSEEEEEVTEEGATAQSSRSSIPMDAGNGVSGRALPAARRRARPRCHAVSLPRACGAGEEDDGQREASSPGHPCLGQPDLRGPVEGRGAAHTAGSAELQRPQA